jgi:hypothetical protein
MNREPRPNADRRLSFRYLVAALMLILASAGCATASPTAIVDEQRVFLMLDAYDSAACGGQTSCSVYSEVKIDGLVYQFDKFGPPGRAVGKPGSGRLFAVQKSGSRHCWAEARTIDGMDPRTYISVHGSEPCDKPEEWFVARSIGR